MEKQKDLVAITNDSLFVACECGCSIFRIYDLDDDKYYLEIYNDTSHKSMKKKDLKKISDITITKKDLTNLSWIIEEWLNARTGGIDMKLYSLKHGKEEISFVKDGSSENLFYLNVTTKRWNGKERYLADLVLNLEQAKQFGLYLKEFIK